MDPALFTMKFLTTLLIFLSTVTAVLATGKRGLLYDYTVQDANPNAIKTVIDNNVQFNRVANWNTWYPLNLDNRIPFVPTIRTPDQLQGRDWDWAWHSNGPEVIYYNEPERNHVTPEDAANMWFSHMIPLRQQTGKKLVGPGIANDDNGRRWLDRFMSLIGNQRPDYLGLHVYETDGNRAIRYMQDMHQKYNLPLYITEIASVHRSYIDVLFFTSQLIYWMDNTPWIERYFFFGWMPHLPNDGGFASPTAQLMNSDTSFRDLFWKIMCDDVIQTTKHDVELGENHPYY